MPNELWEEWRQSTASGHPLETDTELYSDIMLAVRVLGMRYPVYMAETTSLERWMYRMFLALERAKELHRQERVQRFRDAAQQAHTVAHAPHASRMP